MEALIKTHIVIERMHPIIIPVFISFNESLTSWDIIPFDNVLGIVICDTVNLKKIYAKKSVEIVLKKVSARNPVGLGKINVLKKISKIAPKNR